MTALIVTLIQLNIRRNCQITTLLMIIFDDVRAYMRVSRLAVVLIYYVIRTILLQQLLFHAHVQSGTVSFILLRKIIIIILN